MMFCGFSWDWVPKLGSSRLNCGSLPALASSKNCEMFGALVLWTVPDGDQAFAVARLATLVRGSNPGPTWPPPVQRALGPGQGDKSPANPRSRRYRLGD